MSACYVMERSRAGLVTYIEWGVFLVLGSQGLLKNRLQLVKSKQREGRYEITPIAENLSFDKGFFLFIRAIHH